MRTKCFITFWRYKKRKPAAGILRALQAVLLAVYDPAGTGALARASFLALAEARSH